MRGALTCVAAVLAASAALAQMPPTQVAKPGADLLGRTVYASNGPRIGVVHCVTVKSGELVSIHPKAGGFLGFGGRLVAIPVGKFVKSGDINIQIAMTSDEVEKLPKKKCVDTK